MGRTLNRGSADAAVNWTLSLRLCCVLTQAEPTTLTLLNWEDRGSVLFSLATMFQVRHSPTDEGLHHDQYPEDTSGVSSAKDKNQGSREQPTSPVQGCVCGVGRDGKVRFHRDKQLGLGCSLKDRFAERIYSQSKGAFFVFKKNNFFFVYLFFKKA